MASVPHVRWAFGLCYKLGPFWFLLPLLIIYLFIHSIYCHVFINFYSLPLCPFAVVSEHLERDLCLKEGQADPLDPDGCLGRAMAERCHNPRFLPTFPWTTKRPFCFYMGSDCFGVALWIFPATWSSWCCPLSLTTGCTEKETVPCKWYWQRWLLLSSCPSSCP